MKVDVYECSNKKNCFYLVEHNSSLSNIPEEINTQIFKTIELPGSYIALDSKQALKEIKEKEFYKTKVKVTFSETIIKGKISQN